MVQSFADDHPWMNACAIDSAEEELFKGDNTMPAIQEKAGKHLIRMVF